MTKGAQRHEQAHSTLWLGPGPELVPSATRGALPQTCPGGNVLNAKTRGGPDQSSHAHEQSRTRVSSSASPQTYASHGGAPAAIERLVIVSLAPRPRGVAATLESPAGV